MLSAMDKAKLEALRARYEGGGAFDATDPVLKAAATQVRRPDGQRTLPYSGVPTFLDLPYAESAAGLDIAAVGIPMDLGVSNRTGARFGPRAVRTIERIGPYHPTFRGVPQGGIRAAGEVEIAGRRIALEARAVIDDTAAYYERHTRWRWSAGAGRTDDGRDLAWNLVSGVNDPPEASERTVWLDGEPREPGPSTFAEDLRSVDGLRFRPEAVRERRDNLLLIRSSYRQPFGTFSGELPGGLRLAEGYGVMEEHEAIW